MLLIERPSTSTDAATASFNTLYSDDASLPSAVVPTAIRSEGKAGPAGLTQWRDDLRDPFRDCVLLNSRIPNGRMSSVPSHLEARAEAATLNLP